MGERTLGESNVTGVVKQSVVIIRVQWWFLVLPATTLLGGIAFAILSMIETRRMKVPPWKNSALATLANGPNSELNQKLETAALAKDLSGMARKTEVKFEYQGGVGALVPREKQ